MNSKEVAADDGGPHPETWRDEVTSLDSLWFHSGSRWQSYIIILMKYYSCCDYVKVSFNIRIFSCIEIFWLRVSDNAKVISPNASVCVCVCVCVCVYAYICAFTMYVRLPSFVVLYVCELIKSFNVCLY